MIVARGRRAPGGRAFLSAFAAERVLPTLAVAIVDEHGVTVTRHGTGRSAVYQVGSLTKLITAIATFRLQERGRLALSDPVSRHLRWFRGKRADGGPVTVLDLLRHTGRLPRGRLYLDDPPVAELRAALAEPTAAGPTDRGRYSNLGYMALGQVIEAATRQPFAAVVDEIVLRPFGMEHSGFGPPPASLTPAHSLRSFRADSRSPFDHSRVPLHPGPQAAMGLWSTAEDMARVAAWLAHGDDDLRFAQVRRSLVTARVPETERQLIGPGFRVQRAWGHEVLFEHAEHFGHSASVLVVPDRGVGVVALTNRGSAAPDLAMLADQIVGARVMGGAVAPVGVDASGDYVSGDGVRLRVSGEAGRWSASIDGERPRPLVYRGQWWFAKQGGALAHLPFRLVADDPAARAFHAAGREFRSVALPVLERVTAYDDVVGVYRNASVGRIAVFERSGTLLLAYSPFDEVRLEPISSDTFIQREGAFRGERIAFDRAARSVRVGGLVFSHAGLRY